MTTNTLSVELASGDAFDVREFTVEEGMSRLFDVRLLAVSPSADADFEAAIGMEARFEILGVTPVDGETRYWKGLCALVGQTEVEEAGLSTYEIRIVPRMWLLTQRRNYRVFQDKSELDIALEVLGGWGIKPTLLLDAGSYAKRRMRVQYAETDFDFVNRLLEDIGVAYYFEQAGSETALVLADCPNNGARRAPISFVDKPNERVDMEYVTAVRTRREVRPGRYTQSDVDYRKAANYPLASSATQGDAVEAGLERYHHNYGSFLWKTKGSGDTPFADDRGPARTNEREGARQVMKRLEAQRVDARVCTFRTVAHDLRTGKVFTIANHPRSELAAPLLVVGSKFSGGAVGDWMHTCEARYAGVDYRPPLRTSKPRTLGVESATVTGPAGEEIHTDEFGRVRVHFHWDREGAADETSSCWVPVSQAWAGAGFGAISLPRVGQEVLIDFLGADPDRPVVVGRVFTMTTPPPYQLPKYKMVSGHRSETYPRPKSGGAQPRMGGGPATAGAPAPPPGHAGYPQTPGAPAGGGALVGQLGGGDGGAEGAPSGGTAPALPGPRGAPQASLDELSMAIEQLKSQGPDLMDHHRHANGVVHDDTANNERMYIQAQRNLYETVKADLIGSVGQNRAWTILGNDTTRVQFYEATEVGRDRSVAVGGDQTHFVKGDVVLRSQKNQLVVNEESYTHKTNTGGQAFVAKTGILLRVDEGKATILMTPKAIVIDAPKVYINPGEAFMNVLNEGGDTDAAERAAKAAAESRAAKLAELEAHLKDAQVLLAKRKTDNSFWGRSRVSPLISDATLQKWQDEAQADVDTTKAQIEALKASE